MTDIPEWLREARSDASWRPDVADTEPPGAPEPGDLRIAAGQDGSPRRLVAVVRVDHDVAIAEVALVTDELDLAGADGAILNPDLTGAPYPVLVQTGLVGPVLWIQL